MVPWLLLQHICPGLLVLAPCERHWKRHSIYLDCSIVVKTSLALCGLPPASRIVAKREFPGARGALARNQWDVQPFARRSRPFQLG
jgi:hypothetical protein